MDNELFQMHSPAKCSYSYITFAFMIIYENNCAPRMKLPNNIYVICFIQEIDVYHMPNHSFWP